jgi:hypothetical protein
MSVIQLRVFATLAVLAASSAMAAPAVRAPGKPALPVAAAKLLPLSDADQTSSHKSGCNFSFSGAKSPYIQVIEDELMFRTPVGLQTCNIKNADAFMAGKGAAVCKSVSLKLRMTGRTTHYESSDSSTGPANLTVLQDETFHVMRGSWGVAC